MIQTGLYICASIPMLQCPMNIFITELNTKHDFLTELFTGHSHFPPAQNIDANYACPDHSQSLVLADTLITN